MKFSPLRSQLLQLAISGKLTEQSDSAPEVAQLSSAPAPDEVPFAIPSKWKWVLFDSVIRLVSGRDLTLDQLCSYDKASLTPYLTGASQIENGKLIINRWTDSPEVISVKGDVLLTCKGTVGKLALNSYGELHIARQIMAIRCGEKFDPCFVLRYLQIIIDKLKGQAKGLIPGISRKDILDQWIPLPPLEEQHRIVAIIDELMSTLDRIEEAYGEFEGPMSEHFRNSALQQAMQGQLVPQLDTEPEVAQLGPAPTPDEVPFAIPPKWKWTKLSIVSELINGDRGPNYPSKSKLTKENTGYPFVSAGDLQDNKISGNSLLFMSEQQCLALRSGHILAGDFLLCIRGSLGKFAVAKTSGGAIASSLVILRVKSNNTILPQYLSAYLASRLFFTQIQQAQNGSCQPNLGAKVVADFFVPLPPLEEQRRIVAKLEELFTGVKQLKSLIEFA